MLSPSGSKEMPKNKILDLFNIKIFSQAQVAEAIEFSAKGGQALHLHRVIVDPRKSPQVFVKEVAAGRDIAHLFDRDHARLKKCAAYLGVVDIVVERVGKVTQHVDLCRLPLQKAIEISKRPAQNRLFNFNELDSSGPYFEGDGDR